MNKTKILSISVAAYNAEKWLARCLDSFLIPEVMNDIEVLIVNDGSSDGTSAVGSKYASEYPDTFKLINKENGGHGSTINVGIKNACGKYFKIVDSDDWVERDGLIELVNKLKFVEVDAFFSPRYKVDAESLKKTIQYGICGIEKGYIAHISEISTLHVKFDLQMQTLTFRTELLKNNFTPIDEHCFYVDMEYIVFYFRLVKSIYISDVPVYDYLVGTSEQSVNMVNMVKLRDQHLRVCQRLFPFYGNGQGYIDRVIENCVINQYRILLAINDPLRSKYEMMEFENTLKKTCNELYKHSITTGLKEKKETAMAISLLRLLCFHGYKIIHKLTHIFSA